MKILVFFPFSSEQIADFTDLAGSLGDHEVLHADSEEEANRLAPGCEVILGHFPKRWPILRRKRFSTPSARLKTIEAKLLGPLAFPDSPFCGRWRSWA